MHAMRCDVRDINWINCSFSTDTLASISKAKLWNINKISINCQSHALIDLLPLLLLLVFFCSYCDTMFHAKFAYVTFCRTNAHFNYVLNFNSFYDNKSNWCFFWCCDFLFNFKNNVFPYLQHFFSSSSVIFPFVFFTQEF